MSDIFMGNWIGILSTIFWVLCFYSTLSFFQNLHNDDERLTKQFKLAAVICLAVALLLPVFYSLLFYAQMNR